jgi:8-oxo-dGTP diphosphatase
MRGDTILVEWFAPKSISFLPGGRVEEGEDLRTTLVRELAEEIEGGEFEVLQYLGKIGHRWRTKDRVDSCLNHYFRVQEKGALNATLSAREKGRAIKWLPLNSPESTTLTPPTLHGLIQNLRLNKTVVAWDIVDDEN